MSGKELLGFLKNQKGQALLIIVLIMVVALTVGLSLASRTITNIRNTSEQASSQKALSAAEAGIEQAIKSNANVADSNFSGNTSYTTTINQSSALTSPFFLNGGEAVSKNDAAYIWVTPYSKVSANLWQNPWTGNLSVYWGTTGQSCSFPLTSNSLFKKDNNFIESVYADPLGASYDMSKGYAALEISVISGSAFAPVMTRYVYDPCAAIRGNNFSAPTSSTPVTKLGTRFTYTATMSLTNALLVRVNPIYAASSIIAASGDHALPSQGITLTSVGTSDNSTQRKVTVFQGYPEVPAEFFPYILFQP